jgi:hypothetical protein
MAESMACMPEAQLRITVQPGTFLPQPSAARPCGRCWFRRRRGAAEDHLVEIARLERLAQQQRGRPVARSEAANGPGPFCAFKKGERARPPHRPVEIVMLHPQAAMRSIAGLLAVATL